jgi:excisionase family DNA binding protein
MEALHMKSVYTSGEAARILRVSIGSLTKWIRQGEIDAFKTPGGDNRISHEALIEFMQKYNFPMTGFSDESGKRILIVDDDPNICTILKTALEKNNINNSVYVAGTCFDAVSLIYKTIPHIIVLDIRLPGMDGIEACRKLRNEPEFADTKILGISGKLMQEEKEMLDQGFHAYLKKPFDISEFLEVIKNLH